MLNEYEFDGLLNEAGFKSRLTDIKYAKDEFKNSGSELSKHKKFAKNRFNRARRKLPVDDNDISTDDMDTDEERLLQTESNMPTRNTGDTSLTTNYSLLKKEFLKGIIGIPEYMMNTISPILTDVISLEHQDVSPETMKAIDMLASLLDVIAVAAKAEATPRNLDERDPTMDDANVDAADADVDVDDPDHPDNWFRPPLFR